MKFAHILHSFYGEHWHIMPDAWHRYHVVLQEALRRPDPSHRQARESRPLALAHSLALPADSARRKFPVVGPVDDESGAPFAEQMQGFGPIAVIPVHGPLGRRLSMMTLMCGGCDYILLAQMCEIALADPQTKVVVFDHDSPGGQGNGHTECAAAVEQLAAVKPTLAYTGGTCASASYGLAARCGEILASPGARVGSIGTIICAEDDSAQWAMQGVSLELFASAPLKATGASGKKWNEDDRSYIRERMLQADAVFKSGIEKGRPQLTPAAYSGAWFFAQKVASAPGTDGLACKLIDSIAPDLATVVTTLAATV